MIDLSTIKSVLDYNPETGEFIWKKREADMFHRQRDQKRWNNRYAGKPAFRVGPTGYVGGMIFRTMFRAHRLAWAIHYGEWPVGDIDHINGIRSDNRIANLRLVTRAENARNMKISSANKSGVTGVSMMRSGRWRVSIGDNCRQKHIGVFSDYSCAVQARKEAERRLGYHENHGSRQ